MSVLTDFFNLLLQYKRAKKREIVIGFIVSVTLVLYQKRQLQKEATQIFPKENQSLACFLFDQTNWLVKIT